ncbi:MAG: hypothetical protein LBT81_03295 [Helicobacteraceae bacterium]|nr:hypothetical protein [Helicobacteraceae bacterium]
MAFSRVGCPSRRRNPPRWFLIDAAPTGLFGFPPRNRKEQIAGITPPPPPPFWSG